MCECKVSSDPLGVHVNTCVAAANTRTPVVGTGGTSVAVRLQDVHRMDYI